MVEWYKTKFVNYDRAKAFAERRKGMGYLAVITAYLHGWIVSWRKW